MFLKIFIIAFCNTENLSELNSYKKFKTLQFYSLAHNSQDSMRFCATSLVGVPRGTKHKLTWRYTTTDSLKQTTRVILMPKLINANMLCYQYFSLYLIYFKFISDLMKQSLVLLS